MNEQLMKEFVEALRQLRAGAPDAFQFLFEQRTLYLWSSVIVAAVVAVIGLASATFGCRRADKVWDSRKIDDPLAIGCIVVGALAALGGTAAFAINIPEAVAPMGKILGMLK